MIPYCVLKTVQVDRSSDRTVERWFWWLVTSLVLRDSSPGSYWSIPKWNCGHDTARIGQFPHCISSSHGSLTYHHSFDGSRPVDPWVLHLTVYSLSSAAQGGQLKGNPLSWNGLAFPTRNPYAPRQQFLEQRSHSDNDGQHHKCRHQSVRRDCSGPSLSSKRSRAIGQQY